ncbi:MAG TPA: type II toxin-antitoxin system HicB family antitoxin [Hyphomicrobiaceae bacterium]
MTVKPEYPVVLRPLTPEDGGGWVALVPDLPGCMSDGENAYEALQNVQGAIEEWKDAALKLGRPIPKPDDSLEQSFDLEVPEHIRRQAENYARMMQGGGHDVHPDAVHAIIAEWARKAVHQVRLTPFKA